MGEVKVQDETLFHAGYRAWLAMMQAGFASERANHVVAQPVKLHREVS
jgi:hypothetical protein